MSEILPNIFLFRGHVENEMYGEGGKVLKGSDDEPMYEIIKNEGTDKLWKAFYSRDSKLMNWGNGHESRNLCR